MTRPRRSPIGYVFIALMSASLLSGCGTKFGSKLSEGTSRTLSGLKSGAKNVEKSLKGESDYEKEMAAVGRRFKRIPSDQICWQARQEISRSWELFKISKKFVGRNKESDFGNRFWTELTANFYNTVDSALPLSLPDLPLDRLAYAAKQIEINQKNMVEWSAIHNALCKK